MDRILGWQQVTLLVSTHPKGMQNSVNPSFSFPANNTTAGMNNVPSNLVDRPSLSSSVAQFNVSNDEQLWCGPNARCDATRHQFYAQPDDGRNAKLWTVPAEHGHNARHQVQPNDDAKLHGSNTWFNDAKHGPGNDAQPRNVI